MTIMHLMVQDPAGSIVIGPSNLLAVGDGSELSLAQSAGGRWRVACGRPMKWVQEKLADGTMHVTTPDPKALFGDKPSHCPACRRSTEFTNDPAIAARTGRPAGDMATAGTADAA